MRTSIHRRVLRLFRGLVFSLALGAGTYAVGAEGFQPRLADPMREAWRWRSYAELSGLGALCTTQTPDGTVWFGTNETIWSYDGVTWTNQHQERFPGGGVDAMAVERSGALLAIGSWGLVRHQDGQWTWLIQRTGRHFGDFRAVAAGPDGTVWVASMWGLLEIRDGQTRLHTSAAQAGRIKIEQAVHPTEVVILPDAVAGRVSVSRRAGDLSVSAVTLDGAGGVWMVADEGEVLHFSRKSGEGVWQVFTGADGIKPGRRPSILRLRDGAVWVVYGLDSGYLNIYDGRAWRAQRLADAGVPGDGGNLLQTRDGTVCLSARYAVAAWREGRWQIYEKPEVPIPSATNFIGEGIDGALWIGGPGTEIQRVDYGSGRWITLLDLMFEWQAPDGTEWFFHRDGRVVSHQDGRWTSYGPADGVPEAPVALRGTRSGEVWVAGSHGGEAAMARFAGGRWERIVQPEFAWGVDWRGVLEASDGSLWFAAGVDSRAPAHHRAGLLQYREGRWFHHHQPGRAPTGADDNDPATLLPATQRPEPVGKFLALGESSDGRIWTGRNLLAVYDGKQWVRDQTPDGINFGQIEVMFTSRERELWVGSRQFGAFRYDGRAWRSFQQKGGLVANGVRGFAQTEDGSIWVATDHNISRFDGGAWTSDLLPAKLVIPHESGSLRAGRAGRIWINHFPAEWMWRAWARAPAVARRPAGEEFWTVGHSYTGPPPDTVLTLAPERIDPSGNLSVAWRGVVPWRSPEEARLQFSHRLDDAPWSDYSAESGHAFFALAPGRHRLEVRARDRDFNVDPTPAVLEFMVLPPVWRQGWFLALMGLAAGLMAIQAVRLLQQQIRLRRANRELAAESLEHRRAEQARVASEERFRELAETIEDVFWSFDARRQQALYISPAYEHVWGRSCASLMVDGRSWFEAIHPADQAAVREAEAARTDGSYNTTYRIVRPDGEVRWIHDRAFPVRNAAGEVERIVGVASDITLRKQAQDELRTKEEYFQSLIEHSSDLISVLTVDGSIRYQSPAAGRVLRQPAGMTDSLSIYELIHPDDRPAVRAAIQEAAGGGEEPVSVEFRVKTFDGRMRVLHALGRRLSGAGADTLVVVNSRDVTEMQQLEQQFRQAQKMDALGQLAGGVAHDFNNLLTVITGNAGLLQLGGAGEGEKGPLLRDIQTAAERAAALTRQLLVFSRQEKAQKKEVELNALVANLGELLRRLISEEVVIEIAGTPEPLWLRADPSMIEQVVMNLAINARDAMPQGGRLFIGTGPAAPAEAPAELEQPCLMLEVTDSGTGIPAEVMPKIFDPFFTTKEVGKGTGLGLATVFGIVQQHKGRIVVKSEEGRGTTFRIFLPRLIEPGAGAQALPPGAAAQGRGECILLVEDEKFVRELGVRALTSKGYRILAAANGQAALALWAAHRGEIKLLLTDLIMPGGLSGLQLAQRLRAEKPDLPVIYSSGYNRETAGRELALDEHGHYLAKPFEVEELYRKVREALDAGPPAGTFS